MADENLTTNQENEAQSKKQEKPISKVEEKLNAKFASKTKRQKKRLFRHSRCRFLKNCIIWFMGVLLLPLVIVVGTCIIPMSTYMDLAGVDTSEVGDVVKQPLVQALSSLDQIKVKDVPVLEKALNDVIDDIGLDGLVEFDLEALKDVALLGGDLSKITDCVKVTATLKVVEEKFNDNKPLITELENLGLFNEWEETEAPDSSATEEDLKAYYYKDGSTYKKAYNGTERVAESLSKQLYFPALSEISVMELKDVILKSLDRIDIAEVLKSFSILEEGTIDTLKKVVNLEDGKKLNLTVVNDALANPDNLNIGALLEFLDIEEALQTMIWGALQKDKGTETLTLGDISNLEAIDLIPVLEYVEADADTITLLKDIVGLQGDEVLTPEKLIDKFDNIESLDLGRVLDFAGLDEDTIKLLRDIAGLENETDTLTVQSITDAFSDENLGNLDLGVILDFAGLYEDTIKLLRDIARVEEGGKLTVDSIRNVNIDNYLNTIKLSEYITDNTVLEMIFNVIDFGENTPPESYNDLTIGDLTSNTFDIDNYLNTIKLSEYITDNSVLEMIYNAIDFGENEKPATYNDLTIGDLKNNSFDINNYIDGVELKDYLDESMVNIICDAIVLAGGESKPTADELTIGFLKNHELDFEGATDEILLKDYIGIDMANVVCSALILEVGETRPTGETLTIGDINGKDFDFNLIKLNDVMEYDEATNGELYNILSDVLNLEKTEITIGALSSDFNTDNIKINSVINNPSLINILLGAVNKDKEEEEKCTAETLTVGMLSTISINSIYLVDVLPPLEYPDLYEILFDVYGEDEIYGVTLQDLGNFDVTSVRLSSVLDEYDQYSMLPDGEGGQRLITAEELDANQKLWSIINSAVPNGTGRNGAILLKDLETQFSTENIRLGSIIDIDGTLRDILTDIYGDVDDVTVTNLMSFDIDNVKLSTVLKEYTTSHIGEGEGKISQEQYDANKKLWDIINTAVSGTGEGGAILLKDLETQFNTEDIKLVDIINVGEKLESVLTDIYGSINEVTVGNLANFDMANVKLSSVLDGESSALKDILAEATGVAFDSIKISDLSGNFDMANVKLSSVLDGASSALKNILGEATGVAFDNIKISDLSGSFNMANVKLSSVVNGANDTLKNILGEATGVAFDNIKVSDLSGSFDMANVKLSSVITEDTGNNILDDLRSKEVKISEMGEAINDMELSVIVGDTDCFTNNLTGKAKYVKNDDGSFTLSGSGTYELSGSAGASLLLFYSASGEFDEDGNATGYSLKTCKIGELSNTLQTIAFSSCTIRQLVDCGLIEDGNYGSLYSKTFAKILQKIADNWDGISHLFNE